MITTLPEKIEESFTYDPVLICYRGSHSHGTYIPSTDPNSIDDIDLFSIEIPPLEHFLGMKNLDIGKWEGYDYWVGEYDIVEYSITKYVTLLSRGNPNCCMTLWLRKEDYFWKHWIADELISRRNLFLAKKPVFASFFGYARDQLKKMTAFQKYEGYMGTKRREVVNRFGYDCKNACHVMRLLFTLKDFLKEGKFTVNREGRDAHILIDIKTGKWHVEEVKSAARDLFSEIESLYDKCDLPEEIEREKINKLLTSLLWDYFSTWVQVMGGI